MIPMGRGGGVTLGLFIVVLTIGGASIGAGVGYDAANASEASVELQGDHVIAGGNAMNVSFTPENTSAEPPTGTEPSEWPGLGQLVDAVEAVGDAITPDVVEERLTAWSQSFAEQMYWWAMGYSFAVADVVAGWTYRNQWWFPAAASKAVLGMVALGTFGSAAYSILQRSREVAR